MSTRADTSTFDVWSRRFPTIGHDRNPRRTSAANLTVAIVVVAGCVVFLAPLIVIFLTALQPRADLIQRGPASFPEHLAFGNFTEAWSDGGLATYYRNTLLITLVKVPLGIFLAALAAYPIAQMRFRARKLLLVALLVGLGVPQVITLYPVLEITRSLGFSSTIWVLLLPYLAFGFPFEILVLRSAFAGIDREYMEAARMDGAKERYIWWRICLPMVIPALASLAILDGVATWNEFVIALALVSDQSNYTLPLGIFNLQGQFQSNYPQMAAGVVICIMPMILLFLVARKYLTRGVAAGGLKG